MLFLIIKACFCKTGCQQHFMLTFSDDSQLKKIRYEGTLKKAAKNSTYSLFCYETWGKGFYVPECLCSIYDQKMFYWYSHSGLSSSSCDCALSKAISCIQSVRFTVYSKGCGTIDSQWTFNVWWSSGGGGGGGGCFSYGRNRVPEGRNGNAGAPRCDRRGHFHFRELPPVQPTVDYVRLKCISSVIMFVLSYLVHFYFFSFIFETDSIKVLTDIEVKLCFYYKWWEERKKMPLKIN